MDIHDIAAAVKNGRVKEVRALTTQAIEEGTDIQDILDTMISAMDEVGAAFSANRIFIPEMLMAARAMNAGTRILEPLMNEKEVRTIGKVLIGTVKGDLHDIGKNLCSIMLRGIGAEVIDLGVDVPDAVFVEEAEAEGADIVCISSLLTTTMPAIKDVIREFENRGVRDKYFIMVGGAPVTSEYADEAGADAYTANAASCAEVARKYLESKKTG